jgi:2-oxoglutarate dehydrogenase E1 component
MLIQHWRQVAESEGAAADWCLAENMAYASVLAAGIDVRISGLDVRRGTFFHRHAVWYDQAPEAMDIDEFVPLRRLGAPACFDVVNSVLSEEAVLAFEYGYSVQAPNSLTIWEAQFGDFVNGAQIVIDQYISAGEEKWNYRSALVLLLPHGYEGVGPEHSSAHLNRFLALCGGDNLRVACPSTSAQLFHLLRRQAFSPLRKPLVVMTPKAELYGEAGSHSSAHELHRGTFQPLLEDPTDAGSACVTRAVLCSGKLFYDLSRAREAGGYDHVALLRLEEFHPFPCEALARALARYPALLSLVWAQEETTNQGAWGFVRDYLSAACPVGVSLECASRVVTAAGATSSRPLHSRQQMELVARAMGPSDVGGGA